MRAADLFAGLGGVRLETRKWIPADPITSRVVLETAWFVKTLP